MKQTLSLCCVALLLCSGIAFTAGASSAAVTPPSADRAYKVVTNARGHYSIWPADKKNPLGWEDSGKTGTIEECLAHLNELRNMTPEKPDARDDKAQNTRKGNPNITVDVTATKTNLLRGESAIVTVTVKGIHQLKRVRWLWLEKQGVVSMEGGDAQAIKIRPEDVRPDGTFQVQRKVTGKQTGAFNVAATYRWRPWEIKLQEAGQKNRRRVSKEGDSVVLNIEDAEDPLTGDPLDGEFVFEYQCVPGTNIMGLMPVLVKKGKGKAKLGPILEDNIEAPCFYMQDEWKNNPRLTERLGLRYAAQGEHGLTPAGDTP